MNIRCNIALLLTLAAFGSNAYAVASNAPDLPPQSQVDLALANNLMILNANSEFKLAQVNQRKWESGSYEFNLRAGSAQRQIANTGLKLKEWDVSLECPFRLPNKVGIDSDIGSATVARADFALGDAHHEAGRTLLHAWFVWLREQAQVKLWQHQVEIYQQQTEMVAKRVEAGDAPKLELNIAQATQAQSQVSWQQAMLRERMAGTDLQRLYPAIILPAEITSPIPQSISESYEVWLARMLDDNHELGMVQQNARVQRLMAERSRADQIPDPTVGLRYSNEMGGNEKITGVFLTLPLSFGLRSANAQGLEQQADIAKDQAEFVAHRLRNDAYATYQQAVRSYATYLQAHDAAVAIRANAELIGKAYRLGESSLSDSLSARRIAHEANLSESLAQLDANEARYRLALDAHLLWPPTEVARESK